MAREHEDLSPSAPPEPGALVPESPTAIQTHLPADILRYAIEAGKGTPIEGFGDSRKVAGLHETYTATQRVAEAPSATHVELGYELLKEFKKIKYGQSSTSKTQQLGWIFIHEYRETTRSAKRITFDEIKEMLSHRTYQLREGLLSIYPTLTDDFQTGFDNKLEPDFRSIRQEGETKMLELLANEIDKETLIQILNTIYTPDIASYFAYTYNVEGLDWDKGNQTWTIDQDKPYNIVLREAIKKHYSLFRHPDSSPTINREKIKDAFELNDVYVLIDNLLSDCQDTIIKKLASTVIEGKIDTILKQPITFDEKTSLLSALVKNEIDVCLPLLKDFTDLETLTISTLVQAILQHPKFFNGYHRYDSRKILEDSMHPVFSVKNVSLSFVIRAFDTSHEMFGTKETKNPKLLKEYSDQLIDFDNHLQLKIAYEDYVTALHAYGKITENPTDIINALRHVEKNGNYRTTRLIDFTTGVYDISHLQEDVPMNTVMTNPALPSQSALTELESRSERLRSHTPDTELQNSWNLVKQILHANDIDPTTWVEWSYATKVPGRGMTARTERVNRWDECRTRPEGHTFSFISQEELLSIANGNSIQSTIIMGDYLNHIPRQNRKNGIKTWSNCVIPLRIDRDQQLEKYTLSPGQWIQTYSDLYSSMTADYIPDKNSPGSYVALLRASLMNVLTEGYEQHCKSEDSFSDIAVLFDELDVLLFLPIIINENKVVKKDEDDLFPYTVDPGFMLLAYKLVLQMDDDIKQRYWPEIKEALSFITMITTAYPPSDQKSNLAINTSTRPKRQQHYENTALEKYTRYAPTEVKGGEPKAYVLIHKDESGRNTYVGTISRADTTSITWNLRDGFMQAEAMQEESTVPPHLKHIFNKPGSYFLKLIPTRDFQRLGISVADQTHIELYINDDKTLSSNFGTPITPSEWVDPDIGMLPNGELKSRKEIEATLEGAATALERMHLMKTELITPVKEIAGANPESTEIATFHTVASIVDKLISGETFTTKTLSECFAYFDQIIAIAEQIRGASPGKKRELLEKLNTPLPANELSLEGYIDQIAQASGQLERERIAWLIITAVTAAFRISVNKILFALEEHDQYQFSQELMTAGIDQATAEQIALQSVSFGLATARARFKEVMLFMNSHSTYDLEGLYAGITEEAAELMEKLAKHMDYNYAHTNLLQVVDQIWGANADEAAAFKQKEARLQMYCVQASHILYEMMRDVFDIELPSEQFTRPKFHIALKDEKYGMTITEYYQDLLTPQAREETEEIDMYAHYVVLIELPTVKNNNKEQPGKTFYILLDQTINKVMLIDGDAITQTENNSVIIDNSRARVVTTREIANNLSDTTATADTESNDPNVVVPDSTYKHHHPGKTRILLTNHADGEALNPTAVILEDALVDTYSRALDSNHPRIMLESAVDSGLPLHTRLASLENLIQETPYFLSLKGFYSSGKYDTRMLDLIALSSKATLPIVSLFLYHTLSVVSPNLRLNETMYTRAITIASLMPLSSWQAQLKTHNHLLLPHDLEVIEEKRLEIEQQKKLNEAQAQAKIVEAQKTISEEVEIIKVETTQRQTTQLLQEAAKAAANPEKAEQPGSDERRDHFAQQRNTEAIQQEIKLQEPDQPVLTDVQPASITNNDVLVKPRVLLTEASRTNSFRYLLSATTQETIGQDVLRLIAFYKAFVHDGRRRSNTHQEDYERYVIELQQITEEKGLVFPEELIPGYYKLLGLPSQEIKAMMKNGHPDLLSSSKLLNG